MQRLGSVQLAFTAGAQTKLMERIGDAPPISELPLDLQALLEELG